MKTIGEAVKAAQVNGSAVPTDATTDFGVDLRTGDLEGRDFEFGDRVRIAKKAHIIDKERMQEGLAPDSPERLVPIEEEVTGVRGTVLSGSKYDPNIDDELVPIETRQGGLLYVPSKKLEREEPPTRTGKVSMSMATTRLTPNEEALLVEYRKQEAANLKRFLEKMSGDATHE